MSCLFPECAYGSSFTGKNDAESRSGDSDAHTLLSEEFLLSELETRPYGHDATHAILNIDNYAKSDRVRLLDLCECWLSTTPGSVSDVEMKAKAASSYVVAQGVYSVAPKENGHQKALDFFTPPPITLLTSWLKTFSEQYQVSWDASLLTSGPKET